MTQKNVSVKLTKKQRRWSMTKDCLAIEVCGFALLKRRAFCITCMGQPVYQAPSSPHEAIQHPAAVVESCAVRLSTITTLGLTRNFLLLPRDPMQSAQDHCWLRPVEVIRIDCRAAVCPDYPSDSTRVSLATVSLFAAGQDRCSSLL